MNKVPSFSERSKDLETFANFQSIECEDHVKNFFQVLRTVIFTVSGSYQGLAQDAASIRRVCDHEFETMSQEQDIEYKVNVYEDESVQSRVLATLNKGDFVQYLGRAGDAFAEIQSSTHKGWVINRGALTGKKGVLCFPLIVPRRICEGNTGSIFVSPEGKQFRTLAAKASFDYFNYLTPDQKFAFIRLKDGTSGWLSNQKNICNLPTEETANDGSGRKLLDVDYYNQGGAGLGKVNDSICGITSLAMGLSRFKEVPQKTPRELYFWSGSEFNEGFRRAQTPQGLATMARSLGLKASIPTTSGSIARIKEAIDQGFPVVVHGYFTRGHILLIKGYDRRGFIVNDPYGQWDQSTIGRPPSESYFNRQGEGVSYRYGAFLDAVSLRSSADDIWMTILKP